MTWLHCPFPRIPRTPCTKPKKRLTARRVSGSSTQTVTQKSSYPEQVQPYVDPFMGQALSVAMRPYQPYTGQRIAPFTDLQNQAFGMTQGIANSSNAQIGQAQNVLSGIMNGSNQVSVGRNPLLGQNNPHLTQAINAASQDVTRNYQNAVAPSTDAAFARSGAFGGSAWQQAHADNQHQLTTDLGNITNNMRTGDYNLQAQLGENDLNRQAQIQGQNLGNQLSAISATPGLSQAGYNNASALAGIGAQQQQQNQTGLDNAYNDWLNQQQYPYTQLGTMQSALGTLLGSAGHDITATSPNPNRSNPIAGGIGGALGGVGLASQLGLLGSSAASSLPATASWAMPMMAGMGTGAAGAAGGAAAGASLGAWGGPLLAIGGGLLGALGSL
jgi:hypothetical protein